ncbi:MAG: 30S ribosomal protein S21 [Elusimicrobiota bacterium]
MTVGPTVSKRDHENINSLLKRFRRECNKSGTKNELKQRRFYLSPSEIKNEKQSKLKRLRLKEARRAIRLKKYIKTRKRHG